MWIVRKIFQQPHNKQASAILMKMSYMNKSGKKICGYEPRNYFRFKNNIHEILLISYFDKGLKIKITLFKKVPLS